MNLRRGLNRLFIALWGIWLLFLAAWAAIEVQRERGFWEEQIYHGENGRTYDPTYRATPAELAPGVGTAMRRRQ